MNNVSSQSWEFFKLNFKWILVVGAILILYFQGCFKRFEPQVPTIVRDTVYFYHHYESAPYTPPVINVLPAKPSVIEKPIYRPDTSSLPALRAQYEALVKSHTEQRVYSDSLKLDSLGYVNIKDTVSENKLTSRSYSYSIKERLITNTITLPYKRRNQLFIGGGVEIPTTLGNVIAEVKGGVLWKNKADVILGLSGTYDFPAKTPGLEISLHKLIKL